MPAHSGKQAASRFSHLLSLPEGANVGQSVNEAMRAIPAAVPTRNLPRHRDTARNLSRHSETKPGGLSGDIKQGNTYYEELQDSVGRFDFVLANPPFNVIKIDKERLAGDPRECHYRLPNWSARGVPPNRDGIGWTSGLDGRVSITLKS